MHTYNNIPMTHAKIPVVCRIINATVFLRKFVHLGSGSLACSVMRHTRHHSHWNTVKLLAHAGNHAPQCHRRCSQRLLCLHPWTRDCRPCGGRKPVDFHAARLPCPSAPPALRFLFSIAVVYVIQRMVEMSLDLLHAWQAYSTGLCIVCLRIWRMCVEERFCAAHAHHATIAAPMHASRMHSSAHAHK